MKFKIKTFNPLFWIIIFFTFVFAYGYKMFYLRFGSYVATILFAIVSFMMLIYYCYYKISLCKDKEYDEICIKNNLPRSSLWSEIFPLNLCNVAFVLGPIAILFNNSACIGFNLLISPVCVFLSLIMPYPGLSDDSLLKPRIQGFYFTHLFVLFMSLITWMTKEYEISYKLVANTFILIFILTAIAHATNLILYKTNLCKDANYFFTMNGDFNSIMKFFYKLVPIKWVYEYIPFLIFWGLYDLFVFIYKLFI